MTSRDFVYWLQGFFEISGSTALTEAQGAVVQKHLALVFVHEIDPSQGDAAQQEKLNQVHAAPPPKIGGHGPGGKIYRC